MGNGIAIDVLPAVKLRGFPVPASCLVAYAANAVGWLVVEFAPTGSVASRLWLDAWP
jgi:hypothetical protein